MNGRAFFEKFDGLIRFWAKMVSLLPGRLVAWKFHRCNGRGGVAVLRRYVFLKASAKKVGKNVCVMDHVYLHHWKNLEVGDNVSIAHGTSIVSFNHTWADENVPIKYNPSEPLPVVIGNDVWVGCGVRILGGVTIGDRSVIAAGAVVTRDCEPNAVYAGVPARLVKRI